MDMSDLFGGFVALRINSYIIFRNAPSMHSTTGSMIYTRVHYMASPDM